MFFVPSKWHIGQKNRFFDMKHKNATYAFCLGKHHTTFFSSELSSISLSKMFERECFVQLLPFHSMSYTLKVKVNPNRIWALTIPIKVKEDRMILC